MSLTTSKDKVTLETTDLKSLMKAVNQYRVKGYALVPDSILPSERGMTARLVKRTQKYARGWAWTQDDIDEFKAILQKTPIQEVSFQRIQRRYIPERDYSVLRRVFEEKLCREVYGMSYLMFQARRYGGDTSSRHQVQKPYFSNDLGKSVTTVRRALQIIGPDLDSPEEVYIRGQLYRKVKEGE